MNIIVGKRARRKRAAPVGLSGLVSVWEPGSNKLLCRIDPEALSIEIVRRGYRTLIDIRTGRVIQAEPIQQAAPVKAETLT